MQVCKLWQYTVNHQIPSELTNKNSKSEYICVTTKDRKNMFRCLNNDLSFYLNSDKFIKFCLLSVIMTKSNSFNLTKILATTCTFVILTTLS